MIPPFEAPLAGGSDLPGVAGDALMTVPGLSARLGELNGERLAALLAGLLTLPELQANSDRLSWAVRLALGCGGSGRSPRREDLATLLNEDLVAAQVHLHDDPVEDYFVAPVMTATGEFRVFPGRWVDAIAATEDLFQGFQGLPAFPGKRDASIAALSLLRLSDCLVRRIGLPRRLVGHGHPWQPIVLPSEERQRRLATRVKFGPADLADWGIDAEALEPFVRPIDARSELLSRYSGDTPLEECPLLRTKSGYLLALPEGVTTAVRGHLIDVALANGLSDELAHALFVIQCFRANHVERDPLPPPRRQDGQPLIRAGILELSRQHIVHIVQPGIGFEGWPLARFGSKIQVEPLQGSSQNVFPSVR